VDGRDNFGIGPELVGLDDRPRPASMRARIVQGLRQSTPFSSLQRRIIFFNLAGLFVLVLGILYLNQFRSGLIEQRIDALRTQAEIIALTIAETARQGGGAPAYDPVRANVVLERLTRPTGLRARLYDSRLRLTGDTRSLAADGAGAESAAESPGTYEQLAAIFREGVPAERETGAGGISRDIEVREAAAGSARSVVRLNAQNQLIVSVAVPLRHREDLLGALVLSTEGGDIDRVVRSERVVIFQVFLIAALVSMALSILLANTIAQPIRRLAAAADSQGSSAARPLAPERVDIPDMTRRSDEIGELSGALRRMTDALYARIDAIESFAADVAHEIKNPLTSLRSAVETMQYARTPEQRQRLLDVISHDVGRMDRLVTDISNASRLDAELVREKMAPFDIVRLVEMLAGVTRAQGEARGVSVEARLPQGRVAVRGLEGRIAQVVTNLLDNALSFSPEGGRITVSVEPRPGAVRVSVADQGPGVPAENIRSVFERFYTERPDAEGFGNHSGLGLSISHQIVEAHGGRIWVENIHPEGGGPDGERLGARFVFDLPM
jgi:two-component system sensor histidine kinase ChvG